MSKENLEMLKRLEKVEPIYKVTDWIDDWRKKEELTEMITTYPNEYQASRPIVRVKECSVWHNIISSYYMLRV